MSGSASKVALPLAHDNQYRLARGLLLGVPAGACLLMAPLCGCYLLLLQDEEEILLLLLRLFPYSSTNCDIEEQPGCDLSSANAGRCVLLLFAKSGRRSPTFDQVRPRSVHSGRCLATFGPTLPNVGHNRPTWVGPRQPSINLGQPWHPHSSNRPAWARMDRFWTRGATQSKHSSNLGGGFGRLHSPPRSQGVLRDAWRAALRQLSADFIPSFIIGLSWAAAPGP